MQIPVQSHLKVSHLFGGLKRYQPLQFPFRLQLHSATILSFKAFIYSSPDYSSHHVFHIVLIDIDHIRATNIFYRKCLLKARIMSAKLLNEQINKEFYSSYLYLDMSNYYDYKNLNGFSNWFRVQAQEERDHALLFLAYMQKNNEEINKQHLRVLSLISLLFPLPFKVCDFLIF